MKVVVNDIAYIPESDYIELQKRLNESNNAVKYITADRDRIQKSNTWLQCEFAREKRDFFKDRLLSDTYIFQLNEQLKKLRRHMKLGRPKKLTDEQRAFNIKQNSRVTASRRIGVYFSSEALLKIEEEHLERQIPKAQVVSGIVDKHYGIK